MLATYEGKGLACWRFILSDRQRARRRSVTARARQPFSSAIPYAQMVCGQTRPDSCGPEK